MIHRYTTSFTTTNATPVVVFSVPVAEGTSVRVDVDFQVINSGLTSVLPQAQSSLCLSDLPQGTLHEQQAMRDY